MHIAENRSVLYLDLFYREHWVPQKNSYWLRTVIVEGFMLEMHSSGSAR